MVKMSSSLFLTKKFLNSPVIVTYLRLKYTEIYNSTDKIIINLLNFIQYNITNNY